MSAPTRASESRAASKRPAIGGDALRTLDVDLTGLPADHEACFIREYTMGERDRTNVHNAMARGFVPAMAEMFPNANPPLLPGEVDETHGVIRKGGQILMIRRKDIGDAERRGQAQEVIEQQRAAQRLAEAPGASVDGRNFAEAEDNKVAERSAAGTRARPDGKGSRFADA